MTDFAKVVAITGHYGSGKTNAAANLAVMFAEKGERVCVVDLDIVNPYFRTADFAGLFGSLGIKLNVPIFANTNLDIPSLDFDMRALIDANDRVVLDVGGDDAGAIALGQYSAILNNAGVDMLYVVNKYRYLTRTAEECTELLRDIERVSGLRATGIINNSNLGTETTREDVLSSLPFAEECAKAAGVPLAMTMADAALCVDVAFPAKIYVKPFYIE